MAVTTDADTIHALQERVRGLEGDCTALCEQLADAQYDAEKAAVALEDLQANLRDLFNRYHAASHAFGGDPGYLMCPMPLCKESRRACDAP
jgi:hypothetical protein